MCCTDIFLGETALLLVRNSDYEAPFLKGQVQKHQQLLSDLERRQVESSKRSEAAAAAFQQAGAHTGQGLPLWQELAVSASEMQPDKPFAVWVTAMCLPAMQRALVTMVGCAG